MLIVYFLLVVVSLVAADCLWRGIFIQGCKRDVQVRDFQSETETFSHFSETETLGKCVSRPRRRDWDYIPGHIMCEVGCDSPSMFVLGFHKVVLKTGPASDW